MVFFSDNGGLLATDGGAGNSPLRGEKTQTWEGGIRTPAAVRWPGVVESGEVVNHLVTVHDWFPTLLESTGVRGRNGKPFYGRGVWPTIRDRESFGKRRVVIGVTGWFAVFDDPSERRDLAAFERLAGILDSFSLGENISGPAPGDERLPNGRRRPRPGNPHPSQAPERRSPFAERASRD